MRTSRVRSAGVKFVVGVLTLIAFLVFAINSAGAAVSPGVIAEFSAGLNNGSSPADIVPGPDGNLWFTDRGKRRRSDGSPQKEASPSSPPA